MLINVADVLTLEPGPDVGELCEGGGQALLQLWLDPSEQENPLKTTTRWTIMISIVQKSSLYSALLFSSISSGQRPSACKIYAKLKQI